MNFDFSDEQKLIGDQAGQLLAERVGYDRLRAYSTHDQAYDMALWLEIGELGWLSLNVPEAYGGMGLDGLESCVLSEQLGRALAPIPFASSCAAIDALALFGAEDQKARYLPGLADGSLIGAVAMSEDRARQTPSGFATTFKDNRLSGVKVPVADGMVAGLIIVVARDASSGNVCLCVIEALSEGITRKPIRTFDHLQAHASIAFDEAVAERLPVNDGGAALTELQERRAIRMAFEQVGGAAVCLEMAVDYAQRRKTFGRAIGSYQAVKHRLADMYAELELARANAYAGAWALSQPRDIRRAAAAAARLSATSAYDFAARENIQLHGGIGYTWEANCHFYFRRARLLAQSLGPMRHWIDRLVDSLDTAQTA